MVRLAVGELTKEPRAEERRAEQRQDREPHHEASPVRPLKLRILVVARFHSVTVGLDATHATATAHPEALPRRVAIGLRFLSHFGHLESRESGAVSEAGCVAVQHLSHRVGKVDVAEFGELQGVGQQLRNDDVVLA